MKYGKYLESKQRPEWVGNYLDYKGLKDLIKACMSEAEIGETNFSPRTTSLTVQRYNNKKDSSEERFFRTLESDVAKVNKFTQQVVEGLRTALNRLEARMNKIESMTPQDKEVLLQEAQRIGDEFLALEKYVNLNYMGFHKILKKHDKCLPHAPCRQFYTAHLHQQPWVQGNYSDIMVSLSQVYSKLRGDSSGQKNEDAAQGFVRSTTKYWVRNEDVSTVKHHILQHLPVFQHDKDHFTGDAQLINSVYLDNASRELYHGRLDKKPGAIALRVRWYGNQPIIVFVERKTHKESWKGEESVKERFELQEDKVVPFLDGEYSLEQALEDIDKQRSAKGKKPLSGAEREDFSRLYTECFQAVDSKQLRPMIRTQYMRTAFQIPFDATVRISLDTNLCMIKENPEDGPTCAATGRWYRDPQLPIHRTEITRFPHAVLEVKLSLPEGQTSPPWVQELLDSGYLTEVHKFSKFIHGTATLFPDMVRAVPYWVDDESVRASMVASAPAVWDPASGTGAPTLPAPEAAAGGSRAAGTRDDSDVEAPSTSKPRAGKPRLRRGEDSELTHPLLGDQPSLKLMPDPEEVRGFQRPQGRPQPQEPSYILKLLGLAPKKLARTTPMRIEPKTFFANERTFLAWLHMAITVGSISAALLGFASGTEADGHSISRHLTELIALILLPLGIAMSAYALNTFWWRASSIAQKKAMQMDDRVGPLALCACVVVALSAIFFISCIDFYEVMHPAPQP